jgi:hypothetical protein
VSDAGSSPLPEGTRLLHIGPHKTGTTSVQGAFHAARAAVAAQGVHYAGPNRHPLQAAQFAATRTSAQPAGSMRAWRNLLGEIRRQGSDRVVISSEWFSDATLDDIRLLVEHLDPARVHVAVSLRPLSSLLASQWQQYVQGGSTTPYRAWLSSVFDDPNGPAASRFWHRHRHDRLIERWTAVVGRERLTAVVADDRDHAAILRVFERLLGLSDGTLVLQPDRTNRSLSRAEAELIRAMNGIFAASRIGGALRLDLVLFGAAANLKARSLAREEPRIATPDWAVERAVGVAGEIVAGIEAAGVRVIGDLASLVRRPATAFVLDDAPAAAFWPEIAGMGAMGVMVAAGLARNGSAPTQVDAFSLQRLRSVLFGRLRGAVGAS